MKVDDTFFIPGASWIHRADPRVKVFFILATWTVLFAYNILPVSLGMLLLAHAMMLSARIPLRRFAAIWKALLPINLSILVLWLLFQPTGDLLWQYGWIRFSLGGLAQGLSLALRIDALAFILFLWLFTTDSNALVRGFVKLGVPYSWGLILTLVLHYIPSFQTQYHAIMEALQARGLRLEGKGFQRVRALMPVLVTLVISILRTAEQLARALEARCFGASTHTGAAHTFLHETRFSGMDYLYSAVILIGTALLLYLRWA